MKRLNKTIVLAGIASALLLGATNVMAQGQGGRQRGGGQGGGDPAQFQQQMMERYQEQLAMSADEFKVVQPLIENVMTKQREAGAGRGGFGGFGRGGGQGGPGGGGRPGGGGAAAQGGGAAGGADPAQGGGRGRGGFGGAPSPEQEALQKAIESGTPAEIKSRLDAYRDARKKKEAELQEAREKLRKVLTAKQEAQLVMGGLLN